MSTLFIVATPIGNRSDITLRAIETLKSVDFIMAEDPRHSQKLLPHYGIETPLTSFYAQTSETRINQLLDRVQQGETAAYISDAGTPGISDPGVRLVSRCRERGIAVVPIPGVSALTTLVSVSGIRSDSFVFLGFLPHKKGRQTILKTIGESDMTHVFYESVHRFPRLLEELSDHIDSKRRIVVGRELTKAYEDIFQGTLEESKTYFTPQNIKGEFVVMVEGK